MRKALYNSECSFSTWNMEQIERNFLQSFFHVYKNKIELSIARPRRNELVEFE